MTTAILVGAGLLLCIFVIGIAVRQAGKKGRTEAERESLKDTVEDVAEAGRVRDGLARSPSKRERLREKYTRK